MYRPEPGFDKALLRKRFREALGSYEKAALVQAEMAESLLSTVKALGLSPSRVLEIGAGTGLFTRKFLAAGPKCSLYLASDIVPECGPFFEALRCHFIVADGERPPFRAGSFDLVVSNATFQWFLSLGEAFKKLAELLTPGGILAFTTFGPATMAETMPPERPPALKPTGEILALGAPYFKPLRAKSWRKVLYFRTPKEVLEHIRKTGAQGFLNHVWSFKDYRLWARRYESFRTERGYPLTFEPILMVWRRR